MEKQFFKGNRKRLWAAMKEKKCMAILASGYPVVKSADECYPFSVNSNFYYLTGITQANVYLVLLKDGDKRREILYIDAYDEMYAKWIGHRLTKKEASAICGIAQTDIRYFDLFTSETEGFVKEYGTLYLDLEKNDNIGYYSYAHEAAQRYGRNALINDLYPAIIALRAAKQPCEREAIENAIRVTGDGILALMKNAHPDMYEHQLEAYFDMTIKQNGNRHHSFPTIAASGVNATTLHYATNDSLIKDGDLILFDLGCKDGEYCADITRTFPANGRFTDLQRTIYLIVLNANKTVAARARAGMTFKELQDICIESLTKGCLEASLIQKPDDLKKYYFHNVSHSIGIDTHDPCDRKAPLPEGAIISNEPGLYFADLGIGVRIEDDLYLTKDGAINLSSSIPKEPDEIEAIMRG